MNNFKKLLSIINTLIKETQNVMKKIISIFAIGFLMILSDHAFACTTYIVSGKYTADGKPLLFKNRDTGEMNNALVLFEDGKYKYLALVNGKETSWNKSVWGGYNEQGFAIINSAAYNNNTDDTVKLTGRDGLLMKQALMYCSTLEDFEHLL
ncbi:MAG: hypothetical protein U5L72_05450 [Bacteroidales bacterium]|nr:hypothetical protein [Bacteroidales bacterium]